MELTKKHKEVIEFIENLLNFEIKTNVPNPIKKSFFTLETENYTDNQINDIIRIGTQYNKYTVQSNGVKKIALMIK